LPCYNEARRLPGSLHQLIDYAASLPCAVEIVVVVERSGDGTAEIAARIAAEDPTVVVLANMVQRGKGFALRTGVLRAKGEIIFTMDADLSVPVACVGRFLQHFDEHPEADVLAGNRQHPASDIAVRQSRLREQMGQFFNTIVRGMVGGELRDTQCGFKAFRRRAAQEIFKRQSIDGFACDVEILLLAKRLGFKIHDLPVQWFNSPESKVRLLWDPWRMIIDVIPIRRGIAAALKRNPPRTDKSARERVSNRAKKHRFMLRTQHKLVHLRLSWHS